MLKNYKLSINCIKCHVEYFITKSTFCAYKKRNQTNEYTCLICKNKQRSKPKHKIVTCSICKKSRKLSRKSKSSNICINCSAKNGLEKARKAPKSYKVSDETKEKISVKIMGLYQNEEYKYVQSKYRNDEWRKKISVSIKKKWQNGDYEAIRTGDRRNTWLQRSLKMLCDSLKLEYEEEYIVDTNVPYSFDFRINNLLVELDGDYWHNLKNVKANDVRKTSWIQNNHPEYTLIRISENEMKCTGATIKRILKHIKNKQPIFNFNDVKISKIERKHAYDFINAYHYLGRPRAGGIAYGGYLDGSLIIVILFQRPVRQETATSSGYAWNKTYEISRLIITPGYNKHNFISWFVSKTIKFLPDDTKAIISFADSSFGHTGACYKALNFKLERVCKPDYYYLSKDGNRMHKKTLWDHSKQMGMKELEFMIKYNYTKIYTEEKYKYVIDIQRQ